MNLSNLEQGNG